MSAITWRRLQYGSLAVELREKLKKKESDGFWGPSIEALEELLAVLTMHATPTSATVDETVLDMWEKVRRDNESHDVTFESADDDVTAHGHILGMASQVLSAMLSSSMIEGRMKRIAVRDAPAEGVALFLDLLYTGSTCSEPDIIAMLAAMELAHRWEVHGVVTILERALLSQLEKLRSGHSDQAQGDTFVSIAEAAASKDLPILKSGCCAFAADCAEVKRRISANELPSVVLELLGIHGESSQPRKKKQRIIF